MVKGVKEAIESAVQLAELIRHRVKGLHQIIEIKTTEFKDEYEPLEEGLDRLVFKRNEPSIEILLTIDAPPNAESLKGYQKPLADNEV